MPRHHIRIRVRDLRKEKSMTQEALAEQLGTSRQTVISLESGRCLPSLPLALQIAGIFDLPLEDIFVWDEQVARQLRAVQEALSDDQLLLAAESASPVAIDVYEQGDALVVEALVPGFTKEDINVEVERSQLTISGERSVEESNRYLYQNELNLPLKFSRSISLPVLIDPAKARATVERGILVVTVPLAESSGPRTVPIN